MPDTVTLAVNGVELTVGAAPDVSLLSVLREQLDLTGAKIGCAEGSCGACTVLVDGAPARACVTPVATLARRHVLTIEGLAGTQNDERRTMSEQADSAFSVQRSALHPLQRAFLDTAAFQCGYCTPGMIMAGVGLLTQHPDPDDDTIVRSMQGNICRCGMYARIVRAIRQAAAELRSATTARGG